MIADSLMTAYESRLPYDPSRIRAAAIYCSDGRIGEHCDDFLHNCLELPRYDRMAVPGGPAFLAGYLQAHLDELRFLAQAHGLQRIVLIAHQGCAFYSTRYGLAEEWLEPLQRSDLRAGAASIRRVLGIEGVEAYFARLCEGHVAFEQVAI